MKRLTGLLIVLVAISGCEIQSPAAISHANASQPLLVYVDAAAHVTAGGYTVTDADLADVVQMWQVKAALIIGMPGAKIGDALKEMAALRAAGVSEVVISAVTANVQMQGGLSKPDFSSLRLEVFVDAAGHGHISGYTVTNADLPELVKLWHIESAIVSGEAGAQFHDALKVWTTLKSAGVRDVAIRDQTSVQQKWQSSSSL